MAIQSKYIRYYTLTTGVEVVWCVLHIVVLLVLDFLRLELNDSEADDGADLKI